MSTSACAVRISRGSPSTNSLTPRRKPGCASKAACAIPRPNALCGCACWTPKGLRFLGLSPDFIADSPKDYHVIVYAKPEENKHLLKNAPDYYSRLKNSYDDKFYRQEVLGEYLNMSGGKVYANFSRDQHLGDFKPDPSLHLLWALDFNVDPRSSLILKIVNGVAYVYDEIVLRGATTDQAAEEFLRRYPDHRTGVVVYGDASGNARQTTGFSDYEMVKSFFIANSTVPVHYRPQRSNPPVRDRINLVNLKLRSASGQVGLRVDNRCKELVKDFEQVAFKSDSFLIDKDRDRSRTHLSDALGYLLWQEFTKPPKIGERSERIC